MKTQLLPRYWSRRCQRHQKEPFQISSPMASWVVGRPWVVLGRTLDVSWRSTTRTLGSWQQQRWQSTTPFLLVCSRYSYNHLHSSSFQASWRDIQQDWTVGRTLIGRLAFSSDSQKAPDKTTTVTSAPETVDRQGLDPQDERMINELIRYKEIHGDCHVPSGSSKFALAERQKLQVSDELAAWVGLQRRRYAHLHSRRTKQIPEVDQIRILVLESMGFLWSEREAQWQRSFNRLEAYQKRYGTLQVDQEVDPQLWTWSDQQRKAYRGGTLSETRMNLLKELGFIFDLQETAWKQNFQRLCDFVKAHGHANAPTHGGDDSSLGFWVNRQRTHYHNNELSEDRILALESIGFAWDVHEEKWDQFYQELVDFHAEHGHTRVPVSSGPLWQWVDRQRRKLRQLANDEEHELSLESTEKIEALNKVNFDWAIAADDAEGRAKRLRDLTFTVDVQDERWLEQYHKLCEFKERFGHFAIPLNAPEYHTLASWVKHQRFAYKRNRLSAERIAALDEIGFAWTGQAARWDVLYEQLVRFQAEHGHTRVPSKHSELYRWISRQRRLLRDLTDKGNKTSPAPKLDPRLLALEKILADH